MNACSSTKNCPHCAEEIKADAKKCKHCGKFLEVESRPAPAAPHMQHIAGRRMPYWKTVPSFMGSGLLKLTGGIALTFTIIGGLVGIPLMVMGVLSFLWSPFLAFAALEGKCAICGKRLVWSAWNTSVKCRGCKQRLLIQKAV